MLPKFQQLIRERQYLHNVSPATIEWYTHAFKWLPTESPSRRKLKDALIRMRETGLKRHRLQFPDTGNNAYLKWSGSPLKIPQLKEPQWIFPRSR